MLIPTTQQQLQMVLQLSINPSLSKATERSGNPVAGKGEYKLAELLGPYDGGRSRNRWRGLQYKVVIETSKVAADKKDTESKKPFLMLTKIQK